MDNKTLWQLTAAGATTVVFNESNHAISSIEAKPVVMELVRAVPLNTNWPVLTEGKAEYLNVNLVRGTRKRQIKRHNLSKYIASDKSNIFTDDVLIIK